MTYNKKYRDAYYAKNSDKIKSYNKVYYQKNKEKNAAKRLEKKEKEIEAINNLND